MEVPKLQTPTDELTGLPLPILPRSVLSIDTGEANFHHQWYPKPVILRSPPALRDYGTRSVRNSRLQLVRLSDHDLYHRFFEGPMWPDTIQGQFDLSVLGVAGYIPTEAIDVSGDSPKQVTMGPTELDILRTPAKPRPLRPDMEAKFRVKAAKNSGAGDSFEKRLADYVRREEQQAAFTFHHIIYVYPAIRNFFREFVLAQDLGHVSEVMTEEFLLTKDPERRLFLGRELLDYGVEAATDSVKPMYAKAYQAGLLHPRTPVEPALLVRTKLGGDAAYDVSLDRLKEKLAAEVGL